MASALPFPSCVMSCRLEQEKSALQKKLKARGVTADQVMGVRSTQMEQEIEELKKKNSDLETEIITIKYVLCRRRFCLRPAEILS